MRSVLARVLALLSLVASLAGAHALAPAAARADGIVIIIPPGPGPEPIPWPRPRPRPPIPPPQRPIYFPLAVKSHHVTLDVAGPVVTTEVDQVFVNPNPQDLEGTYMFPLPEGAAVSKFSLFMNGKEVEAEILDASKAREIYESIVRRMKDPGLLEYAGRGMVKARLYPIPARGEMRVKIAYAEVVKTDAGLSEVRYPLSTEKWSSAPLEDVSVSVRIRGADTGGAPVGNVFSPSHAVAITRERSPGGAVTATWRAKGVLPDRDFVLYFQRADKGRLLDVSVVTHRTPGDDGYLLMLLAPPAELGEGEPQPKDVVFVVDTSGSMNGPKMEQAKGALRYCLNSLGGDDRFAVVDFATEVRGWKSEMVASSKENVAGAVAYVDAMKARGGTAIHEALTEALRLGGAPGRPFMVVFLTDGEPTIGLTVPADIEKAVKAAREARPDAADVRLFVFGIGSDLNAPLLDRLAEQNRGAREYVADGESVEVKVSRFFDKLAAPVFSDVKVTIPGLDVYDLYPRPVPDLFRGGEVALVGRIRGGVEQGKEPGVVRVSGKIGGKAVEVIAPARFAASAQAPFLPRLFAVRKVGFLLDQIRLHGETEEVRKEVVRLAKEHGIVTPYTSYLVVEDERMISQARPGGARHAAADAIEGLLRGGGRDDDGMRRMQEEAEKAMGPARAAKREGGGAGASTGAATPPPAPSSAADKERQIAASEEAKALQESSAAHAAASGSELARASGAYGRFRKEAVGGGKGGRAGEPALADEGEAERRVQEVLRVVEGRTFYRQGQVWVDAKAAPGQKASRRVAYLSEAYFTLLREKPALGKFLSLGSQVRLALGAEVIEVVEEEEESEKG